MEPGTVSKKQEGHEIRSFLGKPIRLELLALLLMLWPAQAAQERQEVRSFLSKANSS